MMLKLFSAITVMLVVALSPAVFGDSLTKFVEFKKLLRVLNISLIGFVITIYTLVGISNDA